MSTKSPTHVLRYSPELEAKTGKIDYPLTNDVVFHSAVQHSKVVLKLLTCSLTGLDPEEVEEVHLENPIDFRGAADKEIIMDVKLLLNRGQFLNVELQIRIEPDDAWWRNRSLVYLCRCFDNLERSDEYDSVLPATQISIVSKDIFKNTASEFYARYFMTNERTGHVYTRDFGLNVLYLNHVDQATEEDRASARDTWARVIRARTWEELKEACAEREGFSEVAEMVYLSNADLQERALAEAHEKYVLTMNTMRNYSLKRGRKEAEDELMPIIEGQKKELEQQNQENARLAAELERQTAERERLESQIADLQARLAAGAEKQSQNRS